MPPADKDKGGKNARPLSGRNPSKESNGAALRPVSSPGVPPPSAGGGKARANIDTELMLSKLASFAYPAPPTPGHCSPQLLLKRTAGSTARYCSLVAPEQPTGVPWLQRSLTSLPDPGQTDPEQRRMRRELWGCRNQIEQEKMRHIVPFPFFGQAMRFQDEFCALQITDDGRFVYSVCGSEAEQRQHICTTYEGAFGPGENLAELNLDPTMRPTRDNAEVALVEGRAFVKHDISTDRQGVSSMLSVEAGFWRFAICVSPSCLPTAAAVQAVTRPVSPGRPPPRNRRIPYVGPGFRSKDVAQNIFPQRRREGHRSKFSRSSTTLILGGRSATLSAGQLESLLGGSSPMAKADMGQTMRSSSSTPQLGTSGGKIGKERSLTKQSGPQTVAEWKEYYRQRAEKILATEPPVPPATRFTKTSFGLPT
eukprot:TRINITY_DN17904_c0_g1_i1.p1 TRINITY_DN17904_c0_g1~~TRINITY_DN17904_c0_g1_i1.p1  ORF type:complete len:423 (-),score=78.60 TRINITY_DN17904_c0_g1_i1:106-1374(-)